MPELFVIAFSIKARFYEIHNESIESPVFPNALDDSVHYITKIDFVKAYIKN